jgi:membrane protein YqaA with SNARE-associated domain
MPLTHEFFSYHERKKKQGAVIYLVSLTMLFAIIITYIMFFRDFNPIAGTQLQAVFGHMMHEITGFTILGMFYITLIGGLFFVPSGIEPYFLKALMVNNDLLLLIVALTGCAISFSVDYMIGFKFAAISRKLISIKQFYKIKGIVNKKGAIAILLFNIIGQGAQQVTFIMGVFRYNKTRLIILTAAGHLIRFGVLILISKLF